MYSLSVIVSILVVVVSKSTSSRIGLSDGTQCMCEGGFVSSTLVCNLQNDFVNVADDYCSGSISAVELRLLNNTYVSSSMIPSISVFRLKITGEYLKEVLENAFVGHEDSLGFLEVREGALSEVPTAAIQRLRSLTSLNLGENSIHSINCSLGSMNLKQLILLDNQISIVHTCAFPPNLFALSLKNNRIETLNGSLRNHHSLQWLFLGRNRIKSLEGELEGLDSVALLDASWNKIETIGIIPVKLLGLKFLNISYNRITELGNSLNGFLNLYSLDLSYNDLERLNLEAFANLGKLKILHLSGNTLRYLDDGVFEDLTMLETLDISQNVITNLDGKLNGLSLLKKLQASYNNIKVIGKAFVDLTSLEDLDLSYNSIVDLGSSLSTLSQLRSLYLEFNTIKEVNEKIFNDIKNLQILNLAFNPIRRLNGTIFSSLTKLTYLDLSYGFIQQLKSLLVPGFMGISVDSTKGESNVATQGKCNCRQMKTLRLEGSAMCIEPEITKFMALLEKNNIELIGC